MTDDELIALLGDQPGDIIVCGGSHVPFDPRHRRRAHRQRRLRGRSPRRRLRRLHDRDDLSARYQRAAARRHARITLARADRSASSRRSAAIFIDGHAARAWRRSLRRQIAKLGESERLTPPARVAAHGFLNHESKFEFKLERPRVGRGAWGVGRGAWRVARGAWRVGGRFAKAASFLSPPLIHESKFEFKLGNGFRARLAGAFLDAYAGPAGPLGAGRSRSGWASGGAGAGALPACGSAGQAVARPRIVRRAGRSAFGREPWLGPRSGPS